MSTVIQVAEALKEKLNAEQWGQPAIFAQRLYDPTNDLPEIDGIVFSVVPRSVGITAASRSEDYFEPVIDVAIQKKLKNQDDPAEIDALMDFVEEVIDAVRRVRLTEGVNAAFKEIQNDPVFLPDHIRQKRLFTSVVSVTYRTRR